MSTNHPHVNQKNDAMPEEDIEPPSAFGDFPLDEAVIESLPIPGTTVLSSHAYGMSLWGKCAKIIAELSDGQMEKYFLKVASGATGLIMCKGEFESMKTLNAVSETLAPRPYIWGRYKNKESYFIIVEFREVGGQPPDPVKFTTRLADLHKKSISPTGGFLGLSDLHNHGPWPEFEQLVDLTLNKIIPKLLDPLQSEGRSTKPCLLHGDCWDENTATDMKTGEQFIFDAGPFYGHNEYDVGNGRAPRHRLSTVEDMRNYQSNFPPSEPEDDWDGRNLLYSLRFNIGTAILIPGSNQREVCVTI
ncbi:hypothetical protein B0O99DRAFT_748375 [Bisporella sp. PMI_857]|nr:hypothetical protein B0O99DRAFT_748375 [Bisporella sp. PMI_857]